MPNGRAQWCSPVQDWRAESSLENLFYKSQFKGQKPWVGFPKHDRIVAFISTYYANFSPHQICSTQASSQHMALLNSEYFLPSFCRHICHSSLGKSSLMYLEVCFANVLDISQSNCFATAINLYYLLFIISIGKWNLFLIK